MTNSVFIESDEAVSSYQPSVWRTHACETGHSELGALHTVWGSVELFIYHYDNYKFTEVSAVVNGRLHRRRWNGQAYSRRFAITLAKRMLQELTFEATELNKKEGES